MKMKKKAVKRKPTPPRKMSSDELCKSLASVAAFQLVDEVSRLKIYEAIRRLQLLDAAAIEADILPRS